MIATEAIRNLERRTEALERLCARLEARDVGTAHAAVDACQTLLGPTREAVRELVDAVARLVDTCQGLERRVALLEVRMQ
jgi:hypothetical protein